MTHEQQVLQALNVFLIEQAEKWEKIKLEPGYKAVATFYLDAYADVRNFLSEIPAPVSAGGATEFQIACAENRGLRDVTNILPPTP